MMKKKKKKNAFLIFRKKKKTFSPSSVLTWACSWRCFQFIGSEKELWRCCATDDVCYQRNSAFACTQALTVVPFLVCSLYAASSPTSASLFFVFWLQRREKFTISLRFTIIWPSVIHKVCLLSPDDDHANKELDVKHIPIFFFNIFRFLVKKKIENPVWAGKWLNLTKKLSCILEPKFSTQCILLSSCKIKWILTIFILKKNKEKKSKVNIYIINI